MNRKLRIAVAHQPDPERFGMPTRRRRLWLGGLAAMAVLGLLAVVSVYDDSDHGATPGNPGSAVAAPQDSTTQTRLNVPRRSAGDPLALGHVDAPVVISEWGDFQCPFCRAFHEDTGQALISQYVNSGQVRFEWHDLAKLGPESVLAARAARAAGRQGAFWPFHDMLYRNQAPENSGALTEASLIERARGLGLDTARFSQDLSDPGVSAQVDQDRRDGAQLGITHVPSFLINGIALFGPQPLASFQEAITEAQNGAP